MFLSCRPQICLLRLQALLGFLVLKFEMWFLNLCLKGGTESPLYVSTIRSTLSTVVLLITPVWYYFPSTGHSRLVQSQYPPSPSSGLYWTRIFLLWALIFLLRFGVHLMCVKGVHLGNAAGLTSKIQLLHWFLLTISKGGQPISVCVIIACEICVCITGFHEDH